MVLSLIGRERALQNTASHKVDDFTDLPRNGSRKLRLDPVNIPSCGEFRDQCEVFLQYSEVLNPCNQRYIHSSVASFHGVFELLLII